VIHKLVFCHKQYKKKGHHQLVTGETEEECAEKIAELRRLLKRQSRAWSVGVVPFEDADASIRSLENDELLRNAEVLHVIAGGEFATRDSSLDTVVRLLEVWRDLFPEPAYDADEYDEELEDFAEHGPEAYARSVTTEDDYMLCPGCAERHAWYVTKAKEGRRWVERRTVWCNKMMRNYVDTEEMS
jgi:hypothetical protein